MYNYLKHFMDTSRPLPDIPYFENYRHLDPVTKEFDQANKRQRDYWEKIADEDFIKLRKTGEDKIKEQYGKNAFDY